MRTIRIYQPGTLVSGQVIELTAAANQHVGVVLRMQPGEQLTLFCGDNREFISTIEGAHKKKVTVRVGEAHHVDRESPRVIHLAQAVSKGERMELVIQKAVELGIASITPLLTAHCVVRLDVDRLAKKHAQWQNIAIAACEQSGRNKLPIIYPACSFDVFLQHCHATTKLILNPDAAKTWRDCIFPEGDIALLIGPEGGLSREEVNQAMMATFQPLCLGPRILRTETAAIVALGVLQALTGDL